MVRVCPMFFSWELNIPKVLVVVVVYYYITIVGGPNFYGFSVIWVREDEMFVNFKLGNHKDLS